MEIKLGVESNWNSFEVRSIRFEKFAIRLIRKGKKHSKISMKINLKFVQFDSNYRVETNFSNAGFVQNSFNSKIYDSIDSKVKNNPKFVRFDLTPPLN